MMVDGSACPSVQYMPIAGSIASRTQMGLPDDPIGSVALYSGDQMRPLFRTSSNTPLSHSYSFYGKSAAPSGNPNVYQSLSDTDISDIGKRSPEKVCSCSSWVVALSEEEISAYYLDYSHFMNALSARNLCPESDILFQLQTPILLNAPQSRPGIMTRSCTTQQFVPIVAPEQPPREYSRPNYEYSSGAFTSLPRSCTTPMGLGQPLLAPTNPQSYVYAVPLRGAPKQMSREHSLKRSIATVRERNSHQPVYDDLASSRMTDNMPMIGSEDSGVQMAENEPSPPGSNNSTNGSDANIQPTADKSVRLQQSKRLMHKADILLREADDLLQD
ncbi:hypothetical protein Ciccas_013930 [Cichlidogyrus casuarinus]|uniref:Uncharacterized protein n=1 Tax=Cichlidogyrus casuarinus TaxID=1844966 RepID=A0ABD2PJB4_9PLAT